MQIYDYSGLIASCRHEFHRIGLNWRSPRVLDFCERATGYRDAHYLKAEHLEMLLGKLQKESTPQKEQVTQA